MDNTSISIYNKEPHGGEEEELCRLLWSEGRRTLAFIGRRTCGRYARIMEGVGARVCFLQQLVPNDTLTMTNFQLRVPSLYASVSGHVFTLDIFPF